MRLIVLIKFVLIKQNAGFSTGFWVGETILIENNRILFQRTKGYCSGEQYGIVFHCYFGNFWGGVAKFLHVAFL